MADGYGYPQQRRGYGGSGYRYQQPPSVQYESFFDPIPLEFMQEQFGRRQQQYDVGFATALAGKEAALQQEVALNDVSRRNELIDTAMKDIDRFTDEKYGGDYGRAAKDIAGRVTQLRADPLWETSKFLSTQQKMQQEFALKNPTAWIFNNVMRQSAYDPETKKYRTPEELTFRGDLHGNWAGSAENIISSMTPDQFAGGLTEAEFGFLQNKQFSQINSKKIQEILDNPNVIGSFLADNPDFEKAYEAGLSYQESPTVEAAAKDYLHGKLRPTEFYKEQREFRQPPKVTSDGTGAGDIGGYISANTAPNTQITFESPDIATENLTKVRNQINALPEGSPERLQLEDQQEQMLGKVDMAIDAVLQNQSKYGISLDKVINEYQGLIDNVYGIDVPSLSDQEFEEEFYRHMREGTDPPPLFVGEDTEGLAKGVGYGAGTDAPRITNPMSRLIRNTRKAAEKAIKDNEEVILGGNVLTGTSGRSEKDTDINQLNNLITRSYKETLTDWTIANTGEQLHAIIEKRHGERAKKKMQMDPDRTIIKVRDTPINGKQTAHIFIYNADGKSIGNYPIAPKNQKMLKANYQRAARDIYARGEATGTPYYMDYAKAMMVNSEFRPIVQNANIYGKSQGKFDTEDIFNGESVYFEKKGTPDASYYHMYVMTDGKKDYFTRDGDPIMYNDEVDMTQKLYNIWTTGQPQNP